MAISPFKFSDFELDSARFELRRNGQLVKLERIPMELLILLAEKGGNVVPRQEISERLWGKDVFVDTDHGINTAIRKIRSALEEDADQPHFVQTVPGKGYRFVAQVNNGHADTLDPPSEAETPGSSEGVRAKARDRLRLAGVAIVLFVVAVVLIRVNASRIRNEMRASDKSHRIRSVAILPLVNLSGDADQEYFADGLTEQLTTDIGKISALRVISRTSVTQYKHTRKALPEIARELNVEAVIEGTVAHFGNRVRITVSLVQVLPEKQLWTEAYESEVGDILATQADVARAVARQIQVELTPEEQQRFSSNQPVNPEAQDLYFKGLYAIQAGTAEGIQNAIRYFQLGIQKGPGYAPPYAGLALANAQWVLGESRPREKMTEAREAATKALALDDALPDGHYALAMIRLFYDWDWTGAEKEFRRTIELNPNHALAHAFYARELVVLGRTNEALAQAKQALELLPSPGVTDYPNWVFFLARRYDLAEPLARETVELVPNFAWGHYQLALVLEQTAKPKEAVQEYLKFEGLSGTDPEKIARLEQSLAQSGTQGYWKRRLEDYRESAKSSYVPSVVVAGVCLRVGDKDCAFEWLEKGFQERDDLMINLNVDPAFDGVRGEPRFRDLVRRVGLPD